MSRNARMALFVAALAIFIAINGLPRSADWVFTWALVALLCSRPGKFGDRWREIARDWLPLVAIIFAYDALRGYARHLLFHAHLTPQLLADKALGFGAAPTVRLQQAMWNPLHTHWWDYLSVAVYATHFFAWVTTAALLWHFNRDAFKRFVPQLLILTGLGFATYVLYPAVPPWLANFQGHLDGVTRIVPAMWNVSGVHTAAALFESGNHYSNDVAAVPSLHAGYACLIGLFLWPMAGPRVRVLLAAYVLMMGFALVYLGEHFLIDVFLGWLYAGAAVLIANRIRRARLARSAQSARSAPALPLVQLDVAPVAQ